jgi:hypothetical protein
MLADRERKATNSLRPAYHDDQSREARLDDGGFDDVVCRCGPGSYRLADPSGKDAADEVGR